MDTKNELPLHGGHRERLRCRYEKEGLSAFEDHVILELLLFECIPRMDTNPIAHRLLERFGSLKRVFSASRKELCQVKGIGPKTAEKIKAAREKLLFSLLENCDFLCPNECFAALAEYSMRDRDAGDVVLFSRDLVADCTPRGDAVGLYEAIAGNLPPRGTAYAVVIRGDGQEIPDDILRELALRGVPAIYILNGKDLVMIPECRL